MSRQLRRLATLPRVVPMRAHAEKNALALACGSGPAPHALLPWCSRSHVLRSHVAAQRRCPKAALASFGASHSCARKLHRPAMSALASLAALPQLRSHASHRWQLGPWSCSQAANDAHCLFPTRIEHRRRRVQDRDSAGKTKGRRFSCLSDWPCQTWVFLTMFVPTRWLCLLPIPLSTVIGNCCDWKK